MRKAAKDTKENKDSRELIEALEQLEKEKGFKKEVILDAVEQSLLGVCRKNFGKADNVFVTIDRETGELRVWVEKTVVETVTDPTCEISLEAAKEKDPGVELGDIFRDQKESKKFSRIVAGEAKNVIIQKLREEERKNLFEMYYEKEKDLITGIVQHYVKDKEDVNINLGKIETNLKASEIPKGEVYRPGQRIKLYVVEVKDASRGPRVTVSRSHPELVKRLFENEVTEIRDGIVEIKAISREAGSRTKMAVWSNDPNVDPIGACIGMKRARIDAVVNELNGEKIDIINWNENPALLIENALSPAKVIGVWADEEERDAIVIVPDYQLSLAIGKEGQNARLAARLTGYKIDIKSETQAKESGLFEELGYDGEEYEGYSEFEEGEEGSEEYYDEEEGYEESEEASEETSENEEE